jgi:hypothetical protein
VIGYENLEDKPVFLHHRDWRKMIYGGQAPRMERRRKIILARMI